MKLLKEKINTFTFINEKKDIKAIITVKLSYIKINNEDKPILSIVSTLKNGDDIIHGQCYKEINKYFKHNKNWGVIYRIWKKYHLNYLHAGSPKQEKELKKAGLLGDKYDYKKAKEYLKSINLFYDNNEGYGQSWYYHDIPKYTLNRLNKMLY